MSGAPVSNSKEVVKAALTSGYVNLPQAKVFLHSLVIEGLDVSQHLSLALRLVSSVWLTVMKGQSTQGNVIISPHWMFKAWPSLLMVFYSEMRQLCLNYVMQSKCEEWHATGPERWVQENTVTFAGPSGQMWLFLPAWHFRQILKLLPTQAAPCACISWPLFLLDLFLLLTVTVLHHLG